MGRRTRKERTALHGVRRHGAGTALLDTEGGLKGLATTHPPRQHPSCTDIQTLYAHLPEPIDLQLNTASQMLYWTDRGDLPLGNTLNHADV
ncbi:hypothetical protein FIBSPDRAFT_957471 [Athelia psychrophila]|uniref:Uncharacterized protein n=1 Tax=Athelia psychrophila TaxID=1759441 RepID=A0A166FTA1_9AGAM|nr:hypothetical protein FIBSPDRAFT_957471 [Fibularhizoctonia sp. CBS 109695]